MGNLTHARKQIPPLHGGSFLESSHGLMNRQPIPNGFAMTMGTGIVFLILLAVPIEIPARQQTAITLWTVDSMLFGSFVALFVARLIRCPQTIRLLVAGCDAYDQRHVEEKSVSCPCMQQPERV